MSVARRLARLEAIMGAQEESQGCTTLPRAVAELLVELAHLGEPLSPEEFQALVQERMERPWTPLDPNRPLSLPPDVQALIDKLAGREVNE